MYWLFGGTFKTIPGFVAGAILGGLINFYVTHADRLFLAICMIFGGADGVRHERLKDAESEVPTRKFDRS
jgi:uncharacterized membrane protein YoaK (UPF0700 family)